MIGVVDGGSRGGTLDSTYYLAKAILRPWLGAWFRWNIEGLERIPRDGPAILAFNHIAYMDAFAAAYVVDVSGRKPRFLAKQELFEDKRIAWILKGAGQIQVRRGTPTAPMALDHAVAALERGEAVVIFPEGTVTTDPNLYPMKAKTGTARIALLSGVPVLPCALWGTANIWPKGYAKHWWPPRQDICVRIGEPLQCVGDADSRDDWRRVGAEIMDRIALLVSSLMPVVPDRRRPKKAA
jgi:1-acyl-sn-glycerol-3-phosphate acyltransferase